MSARALLAPAAGDTPAITVEATHAARVMMRKSPQTQRTYLGIYGRFARWLAAREQLAEAPVAAFTSEALIDYFEQLEERCSPATVKKERAALRKLARYLHQRHLIDATVIVMVDIPTEDDHSPPRQGLDRETWERVLTVAQARLTPTAKQRGGRYTAARDLALVQTLGGAGLRSQEARTLPADPFDQGRSDNRGGAVYLRVHGKGSKVRAVPLYSDAVDALHAWRELRDEIPELADDPRLFPRLGRQRRDGSFPDAGGQLSTSAVIRIVRPLLVAAGVPLAQAHPHTLRHTFGRLYMAAPRAELSRLQRIMGHASPETTSRYVYHADDELAAEHQRIDGLRADPLSRRQNRRHERAASR